jgi:glucose-6-phosphate 1-epimerase
MTTFNPPTGRVTFLEGQGNLEALEITTPWSRAEIYLQGAQVTQFQKHVEPPLLFLSQCSRFAEGQPIRGGIPIIFPWFGKPANQPGQHGFARNRAWFLRETATLANGTMSVHLALPPCPELSDGQITVEYVVTVNDTLRAELVVRNQSPHEFVFENCLHTYFTIGDINSISVSGLKGVDYLDALDNRAQKTERAEAIRFTAEVDRIYLNTPHAVVIRDESLHRVIQVEKEHSLSTVVWNPWIAKAKAMPDFGDDEYQRMVCVESGNVAMNKVTAAPGGSVSLTVKLSSTPIS